MEAVTRLLNEIKQLIISNLAYSNKYIISAKAYYKKRNNRNTNTPKKQKLYKSHEGYPTKDKTDPKLGRRPRPSPS